MKTIMGLGVLAAALSVPLGASADPVSWVQWGGSTGTLIQNGTTIDVTFTGVTVGSNNGASWGDYFTDFPAAYLSGEVGNGPGNAGFLQFSGGNPGVVQHVHFSSAVVDPVMAIVSLGAAQAGASFAFQGVGSIDLLSEGRGQYGDGTLAVSGGTVSGVEGHGVVRLNGTYTDLYFTTPSYEYWYGATFGAAVTAVPEPGIWAMLTVGGSLLMLSRRRSRNDKLTRPS